MSQSRGDKVTAKKGKRVAVPISLETRIIFLMGAKVVQKHIQKVLDDVVRYVHARADESTVVFGNNRSH